MSKLMGLTEARIEALREEIVMSEKLNEDYLQPVMTEAVSRYVGGFKPKFGETWDIILNEVYPIIQNN